MGKKKKQGKTQDEKHKDFIRVVTPRVKKAIKAIKLIGNQSGSAYVSTEDEVKVIFSALRKKVDDTEKCYTSGGKQEVDFSLD
ncbi:hypothetical protein ES708_32806 [subsurface metagenome]